MRVLLITLLYAPDLGPSAPLFAMLCEDLVRRGHQVSVIAAVPHYPTGAVLPEFRGRLIRREECSGVDVTRVWVPTVNRAQLGQRLLTFIAYQLLATMAGLRRSYDVLIASNPALEVGLPCLVLGALRRKPVIFSVHDLYPDVGVKLGIFRHRLVINLVERMERFCLDQAVYVRVLSEDFKQTLVARGIPDSKLALIWDWLDTDFIRPMSRTNPFSTQWDLDRSFVVMYAGNIGLSQGLERVVEAAGLLANEPSIRFVFVGDGAGKDSLQQVAHASGLTNIQFIPFQSRERLPDVLSTADVSLVVLKTGVGGDSLPSKSFSIMASGRPLLAVVDEGSKLWQLVERTKAGVCVPPDNPGALAQAILCLRDDPGLRVQMGDAGRVYVEQCHSRQQTAEQFETLLKRTIAARNSGCGEDR